MFKFIKNLFSKKEKVGEKEKTDTSPSSSPSLLSSISKIIQGIFTKDTKTTAAGSLALIIYVCKYFGVNIPHEVEESLIVICIFILSFLSRDKQFNSK